MALITGAVTGLSVALFRSSIVTIPGFIAGTQLQLVLILALSVISALVTVILARKEFTSRFHAPGEAGRLGIQAGVFCALWAGAVLTALATWDASGADSASLDRALRSRMWLVFSVSLAALLPSVLCGFVGGLIGGAGSSQELDDGFGGHGASDFSLAAMGQSGCLRDGGPPSGVSYLIPRSSSGD